MATKKPAWKLIALLTGAQILTMGVMILTAAAVDPVADEAALQLVKPQAESQTAKASQKSGGLDLGLISL